MDISHKIWPSQCKLCTTNYKKGIRINKYGKKKKRGFLYKAIYSKDTVQSKLLKENAKIKLDQIVKSKWHIEKFKKQISKSEFTKENYRKVLTEALCVFVLFL